MKCRRIIPESHRYWNIKGWGQFVVPRRVKYMFVRGFGEGHIEQIAAPLRHHS
jgi:hypothetical protein